MAESSAADGCEVYESLRGPRLPTADPGLFHEHLMMVDDILMTHFSAPHSSYARNTVIETKRDMGLLIQDVGGDEDHLVSSWD